VFAQLARDIVGGVSLEGSLEGAQLQVDAELEPFGKRPQRGEVTEDGT
jgi:hypothetical protein